MAEPILGIVFNEGLGLGVNDFTAGVELRLCAGTNLSRTSVLADVTANEISGGGYTPIVLGAPTNTLDTTDPNQPVRTLTFPSISLTPNGAAWTFRQLVFLRTTGEIYAYNEYAADEVFDADVQRSIVGLSLRWGNEGADVSPQ